MSITMTDSAAAHVRRHLEQRGKGLGLRLAVRTTGCSGWYGARLPERRLERRVFIPKPKCER